MPLGYVVPALGRTGADLRAARGPHGLVATGPAARLGSLLPHLTTTTTQTADGRPLEVRLPFLLALWLILGCLTITDDVAILCVYEYMVGAERLGAALDSITVWFQKGAFPATFSVEIATMARFSQSLSVASPWGKPRVPHRRDAHPG